MRVLFDTSVLVAVLSSLPVSPRIAPVAAWTLLEHNVLPFMQSIDLTADDVRQAIARLSRQGHAGGVVYDALIGVQGGLRTQ